MKTYQNIPKHIGCSNSTEEQSLQTQTSKKIPGTSLLVQWLKPQCRGHGLDPWAGYEHPTPCGATKKKFVFFLIQFSKNLNK